MNVKKVNGTMEVVYDDNGGIVSITFLPIDKSDLGIVITDKSREQMLNTGTNMSVLSAPVVTIKNPNIQ